MLSAIIPIKQSSPSYKEMKTANCQRLECWAQYLANSRHKISTICHLHFSFNWLFPWKRLDLRITRNIKRKIKQHSFSAFFKQRHHRASISVPIIPFFSYWDIFANQMESSQKQKLPKLNALSKSLI